MGKTEELEKEGISWFHFPAGEKTKRKNFAIHLIDRFLKISLSAMRFFRCSFGFQRFLTLSHLSIRILHGEIHLNSHEGPKNN